MTYRQRKARRTRGRGGRAGNARVIALSAGILVTVLAIGILSVAGYVFAVAATAPNLSELKPNDKGQSSVIFAADGSRLGYVQSDITRTPIEWDDMPVEARQALVAIEDERFWKHDGVDPSAIVRAGIENLESGETVQGGSTITQQLVRALYIDDPQQTFKRKIREAKLASELEDAHSKRWILESYLNDVPFGTVGGRTSIGIEAAAVTFFGKHARELTLPEAALLAGLPQAPSQYNPFRNPGEAIKRRDSVLRKMTDNGFITPAEAAEAAEAPLTLDNGTRYTQRREPYFFDYVQDELIGRYGVSTVRRGGLKVRTTIDPKMQDIARDAVDSYYGDPAGPSSAIASINPATGQIRALASTGSYDERTFNLAAQGQRQPGSAFKTMVLTAAVRQGIDPDSTYYTSAPFTAPPEYGEWNVSTFGGTYSGSMSLTAATLASDNTVYARLILDIGPDAVCQTAKDLGITTELDCYPAEGLGGLTRGVTPLEMASAYATLASGGVRHSPTAITRVEFPDGKSDQLGRPKGTRVLTEGEAYEVTKILEANVQSGTGVAANYGCPAAGKTGTTDEAKDAWFVGYTPELSTSVWVGYPDAGIAMPGGQGGTLAAPVWNAFMSVAAGDDCDSFPVPEETAELSAGEGEYASGSSYSYDDGSSTYVEPSYEEAPAPAPETEYQDEELYETPPQEAPVPLPESGGGGAVPGQ